MEGAREQQEWGHGRAKDATHEEIRCTACGTLFTTTTKLRQHLQFSACVPVHGHTSMQRREDEGGVRPSENWSFNLLLAAAHSRTVQGVPRDAVNSIKRCFVQAVETLKAQTKQRLEESLARGHAAQDIPSLMDEIFKVPSALHRQDSELSMLRASPAYVAPVKRYLGTCSKSGEVFYAYDAPLDKTLEAIWATQPDLFDESEDVAKRLGIDGPTRSTLEYRPDLIVQDIWDGSEMGSFILRLKLRPGQKPLIFMFYYDGLEVCNGLGQARTTYQLGCFFWALINFDKEHRLTRRCIRLATVCFERAINICGMEAVVHGSHKEHESPSWGTWMERLDEGMTLQTPTGMHWYRGGTALLAADTPAAAKLVGTKKSVGPSTKGICRNCHCSQVLSAHRQPCSFLASIPSWAMHCVGRSCPFRLRSVADISEYKQLLEDVLAGKSRVEGVDQWLQDRGLNTIHGGLWRLPHLSLQTGCPMDLMHIFFEGVGRQGLGALSYWLTRACQVDVHRIPEALANAARLLGEKRSFFPYINSTRVEHLKEGIAGNIASTDCSFPGTASQLAHVVLHLVSVFGPLIPQDKKDHLVWQYALLLCKIGRLLWKRSFTAGDILELDRAVWLHDTVLLGSPDLQHIWKPKNHYLSHFPLDILRWGPPRAYWCMNFEHENQLVKSAFDTCNFSNVLFSAADEKALRVALEELEARFQK